MINKDETIISTYGPSSKEPAAPACARFGGSSVTPGDPGKGADAVVEATNLLEEGPCFAQQKQVLCLA